MPITAIAANGWQATYDGTPPAGPVLNELLSGGTAPGFDANGGAITRALRTGLRITRRLRVPGSTTLSADQVALSYKVPPGTVIPGVTVNASDPVPPPVANWISRHRRVLGANDRPVLEVTADSYHAGTVAGQLVACVEFIVNAGQPSQLILRTNTVVVSPDALDAEAVYCYRVQLSQAQWDAIPNGVVTYDCNVYPFFGDSSSVARTSDAVARGFPQWKFARRYDIKDPVRAANVPRAYLSPSGVDATGVYSADDATARANPFLTVAGALAASRTATIPAGSFLAAGTVDGCEIRALAGSFTMSGPAANVPQAGAALIFTRAPEVTRAQAIYVHSAAYRLRLGANLISGCECGFAFRDVTYNKTASVTTTNDAVIPCHIEFEQAAIGLGGFNTAFSAASTRLWFWGGTVFSNIAANSASSLFTAAGGATGIYRGLNQNLNGAWIFGYNVAGCRLINIGQGNPAYATMNPNNMTWNGVIVGGDVATTIGLSTDSLGQLIDGVSFIRVLTEWVGTNAPGAISFRISADNSNGDTRQILTRHCTEAGFNDLGRRNWIYTDTAGTAGRVHRWISCINDCMVQLNTKHDVFAGGTSTTGWEVAFGVGNSGNFVQYLDAGGGNFPIEYFDPASTPGTSNVTPNEPRFKVPAHTTAGPTAGAGGGDYRPMRIADGDPFNSPLLTGAEIQVLPGSFVGVRGMYAPTSSGEAVVAPDAGTFALAGAAASVAVGVIVVPAAGTFALAGSAAVVSAGAAGVVVSPDAGSFAPAGSAASVVAGVIVAPAGGAFALAGSAAVVSAGAAGVVVAPDPGAFALAGSVASVAAGVVVVPAAGAFALAGSTVNVSAEGLQVDLWPISLAEARAHLRILPGEEADDALIADLVRTAADAITAQTGVVLRAGELLAEFPAFAPRLVLPARPVIEVLGIDWDDPATGAEQTIAPGGWRLRTFAGEPALVPAAGASWPTAEAIPGAVRVRYRAGYASNDEVPESLRTAARQLVAHWWVNRESVNLGALTETPMSTARLLMQHRRRQIA